MRNSTRRLFNAYVSQIAALNGVEDANQSFSVDPSVQQKLEDRIQESSDFLQRINSTGVPELKGEKLGLGIGSPIASRTNTAANDRAPIDPSTLDNLAYELFKTDFDTFITYQKLDTWAKFPDFQERIRNAILRRCALDRITIGWNGVNAAAATDRVANPMLQDVNKGWLQHLREDKPEHFVTEGAAPGAITVGADGDYKTLDALVYDLVNGLMPTWAAGDTELVAIVGRGLLHDKYFPLINQDQDPTEQVARDIIMSSKRLGNLPAATVPFFPANTIAVTRYDNLSIYYQDGKRRRTIVDNAKRDRIENYESSNEAYVVEDYDFMVAAENIEFVAA
ncbi:MAG: phage major capsid protein, P2 family [Sphingomonas sanxanigenens]|uniref:Phage major capsid protein, P2 family n=1 Tax=Sphingomonas sanxanigenens TaxID=397260 RepID=A0A2W5AAC9_9SPHN|nr:MAG: phage major capsid protein, P2 family [Sphingomonas sanxanigenens]